MGKIKKRQGQQTTSKALWIWLNVSNYMAFQVPLEGLWASSISWNPNLQISDSLLLGVAADSWMSHIGGDHAGQSTAASKHTSPHLNLYGRPSSEPVSPYLVPVAVLAAVVLPDARHFLWRQVLGVPCHGLDAEDDLERPRHHSMAKLWPSTDTISDHGEIVSSLSSFQFKRRFFFKRICLLAKNTKKELT